MMALISLMEIIDIIIMTAALGAIFSIFLQRFIRPKHFGPIERKFGIDWKSFKFAMIVTAPAIILHELGHKFFAVGFGLEATFHAAYLWLGFGLILALMQTGIIFFVPAYVSILNPANTPTPPLTFSIIAFAGPLMNLILWLGTGLYLKYGKINKKYLPLVILTKKINMFLFIFNMLPIPGFDGFKVYQGLIQTIF